MSKLKNDSILEEGSDRAKAQFYVRQWNDYIQKNKNSNLGGVAFCWHDRLEGTATWFGISDYKGRLKPTYHALREAWEGTKSNVNFPDFNIQWEQESLVPGKYAAFKVKMTNSDLSTYTYEWVLRNHEDMAAYPGYVRIFNEGKRAFVKIPNRPGLYRLYLYVIDQNNNVSSISHDLQVKVDRDSTQQLKKKNKVSKNVL